MIQILSFEERLELLKVDEKYMKESPPEFLMYRVEQLIDLLKTKIGEARNVFMEADDAEKIKTGKVPADDPEAWEQLPHRLEWRSHQRFIELEFGKWSNTFNSFLRQRIKECEQFKTPMMLAETKKLNLVYLFWTRYKEFLMMINATSLYATILARGAVMNALDSIKSTLESITPEDYQDFDKTIDKED